MTHIARVYNFKYLIYLSMIADDHMSHLTKILYLTISSAIINYLIE
jgi:hypothetical protein